MSRVAAILSHAFVVTMFGCAATSHADVAAQAAAERSDQFPVVVELFTSQGCSSCPPADRLLAEIKRQSAEQHTGVLCLSFHVDYWNQLGWEDPYSSLANSNRQRAYASALRADNVYTPQMIVNGRRALVGSKRDEAMQAINSELQTALPYTIKLSANSESARGPVQVLFDVVSSDGKPNGSINVALVESSVHNPVSRGENAGIDSVHVNVVRAFQSAALQNNASGQIHLTLPNGLDAKACDVIAYVQNEQGHIQGASQYSLSNPQSNRVSLNQAAWRKRLNADQFHITREEGTETPFTGKLLHQKGDGIFTCICCGAPLFDASTKFESGTGWPSFWQPRKDGEVGNRADNSLGTTRTEVICKRCGAHLGHVFDDGPQPTGLRYCMNSAALSFIPAGEDATSRTK